jgi:hypothetical protein
MIPRQSYTPHPLSDDGFQRTCSQNLRAAEGQKVIPCKARTIAHCDAEIPCSGAIIPCSDSANTRVRPTETGVIAGNIRGRAGTFAILSPKNSLLRNRSLSISNRSLAFTVHQSRKSAVTAETMLRYSGSDPAIGRWLRETHEFAELFRPKTADNWHLTPWLAETRMVGGAVSLVRTGLWSFPVKIQGKIAEIREKTTRACSEDE